MLPLNQAMLGNRFAGHLERARRDVLHRREDGVGERELRGERRAIAGERAGRRRAQLRQGIVRVVCRSLTSLPPQAARSVAAAAQRDWMMSSCDVS